MTRHEELLALVELRLLADRYAMAVDRGDGTLFADQFTSNGILEAPRGRFVGRAELMTVPPMMRQLYERTHHAVVAMVPVFNGHIAQAQTYTLARHYYHKRSDGLEYCYEMTVRYEDDFSLVDTTWLLARRTLVLVGDATYRTGRDAPDEVKSRGGNND